MIVLSSDISHFIFLSLSHTFSHFLSLSLEPGFYFSISLSLSFTHTSSIYVSLSLSLSFHLCLYLFLSFTHCNLHHSNSTKTRSTQCIKKYDFVSFLMKLHTIKKNDKKGQKRICFSIFGEEEEKSDLLVVTKVAVI